MMRRRQFITLLGGAVATWPLPADAQQAGGLPRVVYVTGGAIDEQEILARRAAFRLGFEKLGWIDGRNVRIDYHWGSDPPAQRRQALAAELVSSVPNAIMITGTPMSREFQRATHTIPIVFVNVTDPLGSGLVASHRLPAMYTYRFSTTAGGLISYDTDATDLYRRAAFYVDRILKGEKPGNLPVQLPTKYDLVVNLRTAKALGLNIPLTLLASADEVIE
jgi:ABC-type uncharacterized transport system substrate-binding protein